VYLLLCPRCRVSRELPGLLHRRRQLRGHRVQHLQVRGLDSPGGGPGQHSTRWISLPATPPLGHRLLELRSKRRAPPRRSPGPRQLLRGASKPHNSVPDFPGTVPGAH
ncbi:unnamed protein product, partial [Symbiodinium natans]